MQKRELFFTISLFFNKNPKNSEELEMGDIGDETNETNGTNKTNGRLCFWWRYPLVPLVV